MEKYFISYCGVLLKIVTKANNILEKTYSLMCSCLQDGWSVVCCVCVIETERESGRERETHRHTHDQTFVLLKWVVGPGLRM